MVTVIAVPDSWRLRAGFLLRHGRRITHCIVIVGGHIAGTWDLEM